MNLKKQVSIKTQKTIMFIPIVNYFNLFVWLYNYSNMQKDNLVFLISLLVIFLHSIPLVIINIILSRLCSGIIPIIYQYLMIYLIPMSISGGLIRYQNKLLENRK